MERDTPVTKDLIKKAKSDKSALNELLDRFRQKLRDKASTLLDRMLKPRCDGSDAVQIALERAFISFHTFEGQTVVELEGWLNQIVKNVTRGLAREHIFADKRSVRSEHQQRNSDGSASFYWNDFPDDGDEVSQLVLGWEEADRIRQALESLSDDSFQVLEMRFYKAMRVQAIADELEISLEAAAGRIRRALKSLRGILGSD